MNNKLVKNTLSNIVLRIFIMALGIATTPLIVKAVGDEQFSFIVLAAAVTGYFSLFGIGIPGAIVKYVAEFKANNDHVQVSKVINSTLFIFSLIGIFVASSIFLIVYFNGLKVFNITDANFESAKNILFIASAIAIFSWPSSVFKNALEGLQYYHEINLINTVTRVIGISLTITTALLDQSVEIIYLSSNVGLFISWIWQYLLLRKKISFWKINIKEVEKKTIRQLMSFSIWLFLLQISGLLIYQTDKIIVSVVLPISLLTTYVVLYKPVEIIKNLISFFRAAIMPVASESFAKEGLNGLRGLTYNVNKYYNSFVSSLAIMGVFFVEPFIRLWMGEQYLEHIWITRLYSISLLFLVSNGLLGEIYFGTGKVKKLSLLGLSQSFFNVIVSIMLVKLIGLPGVLLGTIITEFISVLLQYFLIFPDLKIMRKIYFKEVIVKGQYISLLASLLFLPFWSIFQSINSWVVLIITVVIMSVVFLVLNFIFVISKKDKESLKSLIFTKTI